MGNNIDSAVQTCSYPGNKKTDPPPQPQTGKYVGVKVTDQDQHPFPNVILTVELPEGDFFEPSTDENGEFKYSFMENGTFKLHTDWRTLVLENITLNKMLLVQ